MKNRAIIACAGSGKTHALIERLLALLAGGAVPGEVVVITFTRKAASEIRIRLLDSLQEKADNGERWAMRCLRRVVLAETPADILNIHTFHGWFNLLLAGKAWHSGWFGAAQLVESDEALQEEAWRRWSKTASSELEEVFRYCTPRQLKEILLGNFAQKVNVWRLYGEQQLAVPDISEQRQAVRQALEDFCATANGDGATFAKAYESAAAFLANESVSGGMKGFFTDKGDVRLALLKNADKHGYQSLLNAVVQAYSEFQIVDEEARVAEFSNALCALGHAFLRDYEAVKAENNAMTFDDLEYNTYLSMRDSNDGLQPLLYRLQYRFKHVLIDEFQDTSPLQWQIVWRWLEQTHGSDESPSVFIVGDEKQAIYRFRHGDSRLLSVATGFLQQYYQAERLEKNACRRCAPQILQLVNEIFGGGYMEDYQLHETVDGVNNNLVGRVEWYPALPANDVVRRQKPRNPLTESLASDIRQQQWALAIVERLKTVIGHLQINDNGCPRLCQAEDVLVLFPQSRHMQVLADTLAQHGIPFSLQGGSNSFLKSLACKDIIALARVLLAPNNSLSLAQVLRSPLFSLSDEVLAMLAVEMSDDNNLWGAVMQSDHPALTQAQQHLQRWRVWAMGAELLPTHDLLSRIFADGNVIARYRASVAPPFRRQVIADLSTLLDFSLANDGGQNALLQQFVAVAQREESGSVTTDNGVRLMTVHKAKGLESPVVVVADTAFGKQSAGDKSDSVDLLIDWPPTSPLPVRCLFRPRQRKAAFAALSNEEEQMRLREYDNLLYVTLTRARQLLLIFSRKTPKKSNENKLEEVLFDAIYRIGNEENGGRRWSIGKLLPVGGVSAPAPQELPPLKQDSVGTRLPAVVRQGEVLHRVIALLLTGFSGETALSLAGTADLFVLSTAERLLSTPVLRERLNNCAAFYTETEILTAGGERHRLDLLIMGKESEAWIVDYKSGDKVARYYPKMRKYRAAVAELYPNYTIKTAFLTAAGQFHWMAE